MKKSGSFFEGSNIVGEKSSFGNLILPQHIGIIMDGNGRWAKKRHVPRHLGHTTGAKNFKTITKFCNKIGLKYLTVFAFSTENWKRPKPEIDHIMGLFEQYLKEALEDFRDQNIKIRFLGERAIFPDKLRSLIQKTEEISQNCNGMVLNIAMNYGGRSEMVRVIKTIATDVVNQKLDLNSIDENLVSKKLYTYGCPDPDLIIRTAGERRVSNFLIWQAAYAEYVIIEKFWPDFCTEDLKRIFEEFARRERRFGGI